ncbi:MAG: aldo/keto reductase [Planctomycetota bacterium]|jgi:aryl-alcohol dehydrogenase-like predicted oxidoreductase|nr:aldo/keto reductase [Planctomycetota bacterium]
MNTAPRPLGSSPVSVDPLGLGCWPLAGMTRAGVTREAAVATVRAAVDTGISHLDTAYCYGQHGESEQAIRAALAEIGPAAREGVVIAGKCGIHWEADASRDPPRRQAVDGRPERIRAEVDESLARLGTDRLDLLYLHAPDPEVPIEESAGALRRLLEAGKARAIGLSNASRDQLERFTAECPLAACQMHFNMLQQDIEREILPWCIAQGVAMVVYWPLMKGLLAGRMHRGQTFPTSDSRHKYPMFQGEEFARNLDFVDALRTIAAGLASRAEAAGAGREPVRLPDLVLAWTAEQPGITSVLFGATSPEQVAENARALACDLDDEARRQIQAAILARGPVAGRRAV